MTTVGKTTIPTKITDAQVFALRAMQGHSAVLRARAGFIIPGGRVITAGTMRALERKGLAQINGWYGCCGAAWITRTGRRFLARIAETAS
jgi:hypothetical protein